ncbi:hypothetical protein, partial [Enterococcus faecium]|uniref:hypothetical protein n=1 Tax=Enterococcus faecium TaxID=1352 RepID=UPI003F4329E1
YRPQHIITDEADIIAPQNTLAGKDVRLRDAGQSSRKWAMRIAKKGRMRGIGQTWITQRPAEFTKGVLAQIEVLIALRFMEPRDTGVIK